MRLLLFLASSLAVILTVSCQQERDSHETLQGVWGLAQIDQGNEVITVDDQYRFLLLISRDRLYRYAITVDTLFASGGKTELLIDTMRSGFDYVIKGDSILLTEVRFAPEDVELFGRIIVKKEDGYVKYEEEKAVMMIRSLGSDTLTISLPGMEDSDFTYRRLSDGKSVRTQGDMENYYAGAFSE